MGKRWVVVCLSVRPSVWIGVAILCAEGPTRRARGNHRVRRTRHARSKYHVGKSAYPNAEDQKQCRGNGRKVSFRNSQMYSKKRSTRTRHSVTPSISFCLLEKSHEYSLPSSYTLVGSVLPSQTLLTYLLVLNPRKLGHFLVGKPL